MVSSRRLVAFRAVNAVLGVLFATYEVAQASRADNNIITAVVSAPVVSNGIVAGEPTEFNVFLESLGAPPGQDFDSRYFGHQIPAGGRMEMELGGSFERNGIDNAKAFAAVAGNAQFILTTGHAQNPIISAAGTGVHQGNYAIEDDGKRMITVRPLGGSGANGLTNVRANEIGFKVLHLRPQGNQPGPNRVAPFTNGADGTVGTVSVRIYDANGQLVESGRGTVRFRTSVGRQVHATNDGLVSNAERVESTNFQHVAPGTMLLNTAATAPFSAGAPYAPRFLIFEASEQQPDSFIPQKGITGVGYVVDVASPWRARLVTDSNGNGIADADDTPIGVIYLVRIGSGADNRRILDNPTLTTSGDGVTGANGSVLNVPVRIGERRGTYVLLVALFRGGVATNFTIAD